MRACARSLSLTCHATELEKREAKVSEQERRTKEQMIRNKVNYRQVMYCPRCVRGVPGLVCSVASFS